MRPTCRRCNERPVTKAGKRSNGETRWRTICGRCDWELRRGRIELRIKDAEELRTKAMKTALMRAEHKAAVLDNVVSEASKLRSELHDEQAKNLALRDSLAVAMESLERLAEHKAAVLDNVVSEASKLRSELHDEQAKNLALRDAHAAAMRALEGLKSELAKNRALRDAHTAAMGALERVKSELAKNRALRDAHTVAMESLERVGSEKAAVEERLEATREAHQAEMADKMAVISELSETRARQLDSIKLYKSKLLAKSDIIEQIKSERDDYAEQLGSMKADCAEILGSMKADYAELKGVAQSLASDNDELKRLRREDTNQRVFGAFVPVVRESLEGLTVLPRALYFVAFLALSTIMILLLAF